MPNRLKELFPWKLPRRRSFVTRRRNNENLRQASTLFEAAKTSSEAPAATSTAPVGTSTASAGTSTASAGTSKSPVGTSKSPARTSTASACTSKSPVGTSKSPARTSTASAGTSKSPVGTSKSPARTSTASAGTSKSSVGTSKSPDRTSTAAASTSKAPVGRSKAPVGRSRAPVLRSKPPLGTSPQPGRTSTRRLPRELSEDSDNPGQTEDTATGYDPPSVLDHHPFPGFPYNHAAYSPPSLLNTESTNFRENLLEDNVKRGRKQSAWEKWQAKRYNDTLGLLAVSTLVRSNSRNRRSSIIGQSRPLPRPLDSQIGSFSEYFHATISHRRSDLLTHTLPLNPLRGYSRDPSLSYRSVDNLLTAEGERVGLFFPPRRLNTPRQTRTYASSPNLPDWGEEIGNAPQGIMSPLEDHERKIIIEFCHLLEKSKQLFNGLRELPQYGHKQWHSYFGRTFDVYTKLWKFQQQHRPTLDSKYGLKRWQIGEIASKIGQLYYHFYLRTSDTTYLSEAFAFYHAIRGRSYYTKAVKEDKCELMVKKLRYYTRFTVVSLLMKRTKLVRELIRELDSQIGDYAVVYNPTDKGEWSNVVDEVKAFILAEPVVTVIHPDNYPVILSHRLSPLTTPPVERLPQMTLSLQEILIIGNCSYQVKFSELTMDMFRILQTVEREPAGDSHYMYDSPRQRYNNSTPSMPQPTGYHLESATRKDNPHKYLLYKPTPSKALVYLSSGCSDLPANGALLLYISADGHNLQPPKQSDNMAYDIGGVMTNSKNDLHRDSNKEPKQTDSKCKEDQCLYPGDIYPYTRKPLFIIVDSDNSTVFQNIPKNFGQPLVVLMSPLELPQSYYDRRNEGNLFTLFLHSPLTAICYICDIQTMTLMQWDRSQIYIDTFLAEASQLMTRMRIDTSFIAFMGDDFLRLLMLRFIFCEVTLRLHRGFRSRSQLPRSSPPIPEAVIDNTTLMHIVMDLVSYLQVRSHFHDPSATGPSTSQGPSRPLE